MPKREQTPRGVSVPAGTALPGSGVCDPVGFGRGTAGAPDLLGSERPQKRPGPAAAMAAALLGRMLFARPGPSLLQSRVLARPPPGTRPSGLAGGSRFGVTRFP